MLSLARKGRELMENDDLDRLWQEAMQAVLSGYT